MSEPVAVALVVAFLAGLVLAVAGTIALLLSQIARKDRQLSDLALALDAAEARLQHAERAQSDTLSTLSHLLESTAGDAPLWGRPTAVHATEEVRGQGEGIPILALAGLEGTAKTMLTARLGAWFDARGERVLLIDLTYLGGLGLLTLGEGAAPREPGALALLQGHWPEALALPGAQTGSALIDAGPGVEAAETRLGLGWLLGTIEDDVRYRLRALLFDPQVQARYDRILLDTPPRLGLGLIGGLCVASQLLIPARLDPLGVLGVERFLHTLDTLAPRSSPLLPPDQQRWILGLRTPPVEARLVASETDAKARIGALLGARALHCERLLGETVSEGLGRTGAVGQGFARPLSPEIDRLGTVLAALAPSRDSAARRASPE
ncbi:MAG: ParA family protein [Pseudomonadota bacterium]